MTAVGYDLTLVELGGEQCSLFFFVHGGRGGVVEHKHSDYSKEGVSVYSGDTRAQVCDRKENSTINYFGFSVK